MTKKMELGELCPIFIIKKFKDLKENANILREKWDISKICTLYTV